MTFQKLALAALTLGSLLLLCPRNAMAQITGRIEADIPFAFTVENTTLPAGKYVLAPEEQGDTAMVIRNESGDHAAVLFLTERRTMNKPPAKTELFFDKYGDREFLSQIFVEGEPDGVELVKSRTEKKLLGHGQKPHHHSHPGKHHKQAATKGKAGKTD